MNRLPGPRLVGGAALLWTFLSACTKGQVAPAAAVCDAPQGSAAAAHDLATANTEFALSLFTPAASAAGASANVVLSPYSASTTLILLDAGAAGGTDAQIRGVLDLPEGAATTAPAYATLACGDETDGNAKGDELTVANAMWAQKGKAFGSAFLSLLADGYQKTRLVLTDAVYFKGSWQTAFDASLTAPRTFTLGDGSAVQVPTMDSNVQLASGPGVGAAQGRPASGAGTYELAYIGGGLAMDFLLPATGQSLATFEAGLTPGALAASVAALGKPNGTEFYLPRFTFTTRVELSNVLAGMGMPDAFDPNVADLSGMDGMRDLSVGAVVQQASIEVDEQGTVATAATGASVCNCDVVIEPPEVHIDRPFVFLIRDVKNGSILFMGHVRDPRGSAA